MKGSKKGAGPVRQDSTPAGWSGPTLASPAYFPEITDPEKRRIAARKLVAKEKGSTYGAVKRADLRFQKTGKTALFWGAPVSNRFPR